MPLERLVLILTVVIAAAGATIWVAATVIAAAEVPFGWLALIPTVLVTYVLWRVIVQRVGNAEDDHYDRLDK